MDYTLLLRNQFKELHKRSNSYFKDFLSDFDKTFGKVRSTNDANHDAITEQEYETFNKTVQNYSNLLDNVEDTLDEFLENLPNGPKGFKEIQEPENNFNEENDNMTKMMMFMYIFNNNKDGELDEFIKKVRESPNMSV